MLCMSSTLNVADYAISGIQQVGVGVPDKNEAWRWYRRHFNIDVPVFQEAAEAPLMTLYTGGLVHSRDAALALNLAGGGGLEIWQYTSRKPVPPSFQPGFGDQGILAVKLKAPDVGAVEQKLRQAGVSVLSPTTADPAGNDHLFVTDTYGYLFEIVQASDGWFSDIASSGTGGVSGVTIGVSEVTDSLRLYSDVLGYDRVLYDETGRFEDLAGLPGGGTTLRRILLTHSAVRQGAFAALLGPTTIELVQGLDRAGRRIFADRYWGDMGFIHLCFDIVGMDALRQTAEEAGFGFTVDSGTTFDMGEAGGRFAYLEDCDGTLIEFVETHRIPLIRAIGWYLDLTKRDVRRPLPRWMLKALAVSRVRD